ncbi:hypothetical protein ACC692_37090, partial [Rhizobium ruizarguesonis]
LDVAQTVSIKTPIIVISVAVLMLIGLFIDRRAFVTSGLLSLGFAIYGIFLQGSATVDTYIFTTLIVVGATSSKLPSNEISRRTLKSSAGAAH